MGFWGYTPSAVPAAGSSIAVDRNSDWLRNVATASSVTKQEPRLLGSDVFSSYVILLGSEPSSQCFLSVDCSSVSVRVPRGTLVKEMCRLFS